MSSGNVELFGECVRDGFDVVNYVEQENGLIHLASYHGQLIILQQLITMGTFLFLYSH